MNPTPTPPIVEIPAWLTDFMKTGELPAEKTLSDVIQAGIARALALLDLAGPAHKASFFAAFQRKPLLEMAQYLRAWSKSPVLPGLFLAFAEMAEAKAETLPETPPEVPTPVPPASAPPEPEPEHPAYTLRDAVEAAVDSAIRSFGAQTSHDLRAMLAAAEQLETIPTMTGPMVFAIEILGNRIAAREHEERDAAQAAAGAHGDVQ